MHPGTTLTDAVRAAELWAIPRVSAERTSRKALTQRHWSAPSLEQMAELSAGELPRELIDSSELTPQARRIYARSASAWPTPTATDGKGAQTRTEGKERTAGDDRLATRAERIYSGPPDPPIGTDGRASSTERRTLNPLFVEWLMGWPIGWTGSGSVGTEWFHWRRRWRSAFSRLVS